MAIWLHYYPSNPNYALLTPREGDAGWDIMSYNDPITLLPNDLVEISTGIHVAIPAGFVGLIKERSSLGKKGVKIMGGVIDSSYRGTLSVMMILMAGSKPEDKITISGKIAQLVIVPTPLAAALGYSTYEAFMRASGQTERGNHGFGSTDYDAKVDREVL